MIKLIGLFLAYAWIFGQVLYQYHFKLGKDKHEDNVWKACLGKEQ